MAVNAGPGFESEHPRGPTGRFASKPGRAEVDVELGAGSDLGPVGVEDPSVQAGVVHDEVVHPDYGTFSRVRDGVYGSEPYAMRVQFERPVDDAEIARSAQLVGYSLKTAGFVESASDPERDSPYSFVISADTTKGRAHAHLDDFEAHLGDYLSNGTPVRSTDRSGPGTRGTRLVPGLDDAPRYELYYDSVEHG